MPIKDRIEIPIKKLSVILSLCLLFIAACLLFIIMDKILIKILIAGWYVFVLIKFIPLLFLKDGLIIDNIGIIDNRFSYKRILWENIVKIKEEEFQFEHKFSRSYNAIVIIVNNGKPIKIFGKRYYNFLQCEHEELLNLLQERFEKYRQESHSFI